MARNFRNSYYGKMPVRGIEDKKLLENLMKDEVIKEEELRDFCQYHQIPAMYRFLVWKILLGILPVHGQSHRFVMRQRTEQYDDLIHALNVMQKIDEQTPQAKVFLFAYLLESGMFGLEVYYEPWHDRFISVADALSRMMDNTVDAYWLTVKIYKLFDTFSSQYEDYETEFMNVCANVLLRENSKLHAHLTKVLESVQNLPYHDWFNNCFADSIQAEGGLERIWDVMISGSFHILAYVAVQVLLVNERSLMKLNTNEEVLKHLQDIPYPDDMCELISCKAVDLWRKYQTDKQL